jgi:hypothetical protein
VGFDDCHYLQRHVGGKLRGAYAELGREAVARLDQAARDPGYEGELRDLVRRSMAGRSIEGSF